MTTALADVPEQVLLNKRIFGDFGTGIAKLTATTRASTSSIRASHATSPAFTLRAQLVQIDAADLDRRLGR